MKFVTRLNVLKFYFGMGTLNYIAEGFTGEKHEKYDILKRFSQNTKFDTNCRFRNIFQKEIF